MLTGNDTHLLYLDYGADAQRCGLGDIDLSERGMRFTSRWQFSIGTQLSVSLVHLHPRLGQCRMTLEGIVVWCEPKADKGHESDRRQRRRAREHAATLLLHLPRAAAPAQGDVPLPRRDQNRGARRRDPSRRTRALRFLHLQFGEWAGRTRKGLNNLGRWGCDLLRNREGTSRLAGVTGFPSRNRRNPLCTRR